MTLKHGQDSKLIVELVDQYATENPSRVWAAVLVNESDLSKGFKDITYGQLANAINHAAFWLQNHLPPASRAFETVAYAGPKDLRYPIVALAVVKTNRKVILRDILPWPRFGVD